ncbi:MAG TPA: glycosyltransferase [Thermoanaerobaculia bacterium]|nr:glycosyltransferase [Thermoanaerobaculia bacterium]
MITKAMFFYILQLAILGYFAVINSIYFLFTIIAFFDLLSFDRRLRRRGVGDVLSGTTFRPISIIVPAYNERATIVSNVNSMLEVGYPEFEVIVVNDGSDDDTLERLQEGFSLFPVTDTTRPQLKTRPIRRIYRSLDHPNLTVIDKERGGKSDALNAGINVSSYPLFCSIDADSLLNSDALLRIARPFVEDDRIVAAGGIVRVLNGSIVENDRVVKSRAPSKLIHLCQAIEYVRGFLTGRTALARLNALLIISGAFGLFLKRAIIEVGGYNSETVCEDMELIVRVHRHAREKKLPWRVIFVPDPVLWTQVPSDYRSLMRQRDRWQRGLLESLLIHAKMFMNPRYGAVGMIGMPFYFFFEALGPVIEFLGYILLPILWFLGLFDVQFALMFFSLAVMYNIMLSLLALIVDDLLFQRYDRPVDLVKMMFAAFFEFIGYRQILTFRRAAAFVTVLFRRGHWGRIRRETIARPEAASV